MKRAAGILALAVLALLASGTYMLWHQFNYDPQFTSHFASAQQTVTSYALIAPAIEGRPSIGDANAPITIIVYLDLASPSTEAFARTSWLQIRDDYVATGKAKVIFKNALNVNDERDNTIRWQRAILAQCGGERVMRTMLESQGLKAFDGLEPCKGNDTEQLRTDMSETERYGFSGVSPHFVIGIDGNDNTLITGIPSITQLNDTLRSYETRIGE